jgi:hypothetical protein
MCIAPFLITLFGKIFPMTDFVIQPAVAQGLATPQSRSVVQRGAAAAAGPTHDAIASRAYDLYVQTGQQQGQCQQNWKQAEQALCHEAQATCEAQEDCDSDATPAAAGSNSSTSGVKTAPGKLPGMAPARLGDRPATPTGTNPLPRDGQRHRNA